MFPQGELLEPYTTDVIMDFIAAFPRFLWNDKPLSGAAKRKLRRVEGLPEKRTKACMRIDG